MKIFISFCLFIFTLATQARTEVKSIILLIGDGMGVGQIVIARYSSKGIDGRLILETLPQVALMNTHAADSPVTDSPAAATAMATGQKTILGRIGICPEGDRLKSLLTVAQGMGKSVGLVTTSTVYDATLAAFVSNVFCRRDRDEIVSQMMERDIDVILGGGKDRFLPDKRRDDRNIIKESEAKGYTFVDNSRKLKRTKAKKLLGLFHNSFMNFVLDRDEYNVEKIEPTLSEMTKKAIDILSENEKGFFLMVEGARIDHAAHAADFTGVIAEMLAFDEAVGVALDFAKKEGDVLVIVTGDHETMGFALTEPMDWELLKNIEVSTEYMALQLEKDRNEIFTSESIKDVFSKYAGIDRLSEEEIKIIQDASGLFSYLVGWEIGSIIAFHSDAGVMHSRVRKKCATKGHSGNIIPVFSFGPGSNIFEGLIDNTDINKKIIRLWE